jgi:hypothetical protein
MSLDQPTTSTLLAGLIAMFDSPESTIDVDVSLHAGRREPRDRRGP